MKAITGLLVLVAVFLGGQATAATGDGLTEGLVNPGYEEKPSWFKNSFLDLREDVGEAAVEGRRVMLYFYQDGCPYCARLLQDNFGQAEISEKTQQHFDVIAINMWGDREVVDMSGNDTTEKSFATSMKVMFTPTLLFLDEQGQEVLRINGYFHPHKFDIALDYSAGGHEKDGPFREYLAKRDPVPATGKLHIQDTYLKQPYKLDSIVRLSKKPLLVYFEQKQCTACDELHEDILLRPESRELEQQFQPVLLDTWADTPVVTPDGKKTTVAKWARGLDIQYTPSLVFFDNSGKEVFRTEGYLKAFHIQSAMEYVATGAYQHENEFQRFVDERADNLRAQGIEVDLME